MKKSVRRSWLIASVVALAFGVGAIRATSAEDLPADTTTITSLTPEQAATLVAEFKATDLRLGGLAALTPEVARALAAFKRGSLYLDGLSSLPVDVAAELAASKGLGLSFNGVTTLSAAEAEAIVAFQGNTLSLGGLTTLAPDVARAIGTFKGSVDLNGLTTLPVESATAVAEVRGQRLSLNALTTLSPESARAIASFKGSALFLCGLTTLSADAAEALAAYKGHLLVVPEFLTAIGRDSPLNAGTARLVCACCARLPPGGKIQLPAVTAIDTPEAVEAARILATVKAPIELDNLRTIGKESLEALMENPRVKIPPVEKLDVISEGGGSDDVVVP